jgi:adenine-specific DNA methylase
VTIRKKMIEVSIPLEAINAASAREKSIRHGHPSTLHLWWARRPLAACRAVLFAQLVDDPSAWPERFDGEAAMGSSALDPEGFCASLQVRARALSLLAGTSRRIHSPDPATRAAVTQIAGRAALVSWAIAPSNSAPIA